MTDFIILFSNTIIQTLCCYLLYIRSHFPISSFSLIDLIHSLSHLIRSDFLSDNLRASLLHSAANLCHSPSSAKSFEDNFAISDFDLFLNNNSRDISFECLNFIHKLIQNRFININIHSILKYVCDEEEQFSLLSLKILKKVVEMNFDENLIKEGLMIKLNELQTKEATFHQKELVARIYGKILIFGKKEPFEDIINESFLNSCYTFLFFSNEKVLSALVRGFYILVRFYSDYQIVATFFSQENLINQLYNIFENSDSKLLENEVSQLLYLLLKDFSDSADDILFT